MKKKLINNQFSSSVLECITTSIVVLDEQLLIIYMNQSAETLFGITLGQVQHQPFKRIVLIGKKDKQALDSALINLKGFSVRESEFKLTYHGVARVDYTVTANKDNQGLTMLSLEINQVDRRLKIMKEEALLSQQKTTKMLVRSLAHEIKNPLGGLRGAAQLLDYELDSDELKEYTAIIIKEADRLKNLMNRMLGPNSRPNFKRVNIHQITEQVRKLLLVDLPKNVSLKFDYDPSLPEINADSDRLVQAVLNIASNAIQAVTEGGLVIFKTRSLRNITIGKQCYRLVICLQVIDDGEGVAKEMQEKIFFPMVTTKTEGTGLGLSIAQSHINEHGGLIEYDRIDEQSIFSIILPIN